MNDEEHDRPIRRVLRRNMKGKRAKTFTGCWTCRSRKVKCDLRRPTCERCDKSGLECGGYDIKLRWTKCIKFDMYGIPLPTASAQNTNDEQQYQRRNIDFVKYGEEYEFYEDMDEELSALHKPPPDKIEDGKTWIIKKFGVFRGADKGADLQHKLRKVPTGHTQSSNTNSNITLNNTVIEDPGTFDFFENDPFFVKFPTDHEWISKELEDDILSSTAFRGFPMANLALSSTSTSTTTPMDHGFHKNERICPQTENVNMNRANQDEDTSQAPDLLDDEYIYTGTSEPPYDIGLDCSVTQCVSGDRKITTDLPFSEKSIPSAVMEIVNESWPGPDIFSGATNVVQLSGPPKSLIIHGLTRFLLDYYIRKVADLMTVVALPTNPWKTLYFPRALQAVGDLAGLGYTSRSRNALLNALLAVSCFNLSSKFSKDSDQSRYFINLGIEFRSQASNFLRLCLAKDVQKERYKDVLTALLSINSVDVVWGTMTDCHYHLSMCEEFIRARMKKRPKISQKAKTLHRIFSFLKLVQDSTSLDKVERDEITIAFNENTELLGTMQDNDESGISGVQADESNEEEPVKIIRFRERLDEKDGKIKIHSDEECESPEVRGLSDDDKPIFMDIVSESFYSTDPEHLDYCNVLGTDNLYGLPKSLILLFSDCVHLARHKAYFKIRRVSLPRQFIYLRQKLEDRLMAWRSEWEFKEESGEFINNTAEGVYHHMMSFYNGLLVYFFTIIKGLGESSIQSYVDKVLFHLKTLGDLVITKCVRIVPLLWQGFVAGCECIDPKTQLEYKNWAADLAHSGVGSYWGARQVMTEVWRRRIHKEGGDDWNTVCRDWEMNLMLS